MKFSSSIRRPAKAVATALATVLAGTGLLAATPAAKADAATTRSYVVNARTPAQTSAVQAAAIKAGGKVVQSWPGIGVVVVRSSSTRFPATVKRLGGKAVLSAGDARMEAATEKVTLGRSVTVKAPGRRVAGASTTPGKSDPMAAKQTHLSLTRALAAQKIHPGARNVVVGVIDTGIDDTHPDLAGNFSAADSVDCTTGGRPNSAPGAWRDADGHGTHVAGTIAAARNGRGVTGMAPNVKVASVKVVNAAGETYPEYLVCAYMWAAERQLAVTNASINVFDLWCGTLQVQQPAITSVQRAIAHAAGRRVLNVSSTGNAGMDVSWQRGETCHDPIAESKDVLHVGSVTNRGTLSEFSSRGTGMVDVAAPGEGVLATAPRGRYTRRTGTSQAAPQVAGTLALMRSRKPAASNATLVKTLRATTKAPAVRTLASGCKGTPRANSCTGSGQLDTLAALKSLG